MSEPQNTDIAKPKRGRWRRIFKRLLITLIILALVMLFGVIPWGLAALVTGAGTRPMDRNLTQIPADLGAQFKGVEFLTSDNVKISGWLVRSGDKHATIVYSHVLFPSRREVLERAVELNKPGYCALLYDSRNHRDRVMA